jgi:hypothetical protein
MMFAKMTVAISTPSFDAVLQKHGLACCVGMWSAALNGIWFNHLRAILNN